MIFNSIEIELKKKKIIGWYNNRDLNPILRNMPRHIKDFHNPMCLFYFDYFSIDNVITINILKNYLLMFYL